ncbi:helix-turn-helix domain-containing protein [Castellaniella caeni]|uniref:helix-turn-helix domain-containing protein n=1 Tax=Castellaniella caeni TaxID=266123 RepID=UPI000AB3F719|nr:helix-turn-helix domain-containing protein [Castellaniella caeni]
MRERIDCALLAPGHADWAMALDGRYLGGRLQLHGVQTAGAPPERVLDDPALARGRYDAALAYADGATLSAWRRALAARAGTLPAVLLIYAVGLKAQAIHDLISLGATDFVQAPFCPEELRARLEHALDRLAPVSLAEPAPRYGAGGACAAPGMPVLPAEAALCASILSRSGGELEAYAVAVALQRATSRDSFRAAKSQVVARFEQAYIRAALGRHGGNITLAARTAQKHRRAFWALMRKHDIDPGPYRVDPGDAG